VVAVQFEPFADLPPFLKPEQARELTQLGRSQFYEQMRLYRDSGGREGIPNMRFGRVLRIPTAGLLRMALIDLDDDQGGGHAA
jgi:hypothetical protein